MEETAANEATHCKVNTDLISWSLDVDPEHTVQALYRQFRTFAMPGDKGIEDFYEYQREMAIAGLFDFVTLRKVQRERLKQLKVDGLELSGRTAEYRDKLLEHVDDNSSRNQRLDSGIEKLREERIKTLAERGMVPFILGRTVEAPRGEPLRRIAA